MEIVIKNHLHSFLIYNFKMYCNQVKKHIPEKKIVFCSKIISFRTGAIGINLYSSIKSFDLLLLQLVPETMRLV